MLTPSPGDLIAIAALLSEAALPPLESSSFRAEDFRVAQEDSLVVGAIGIERYETDGLLRSLVVAPSARGQGLGEALVHEIEHHARAIGLGSLYILTTTADKFFDRLGYTRVHRDTAPSTVQKSSEFSTLCPSSAVCMCKALNKGATR